MAMKDDNESDKNTKRRRSADAIVVHPTVMIRTATMRHDEAKRSERRKNQNARRKKGKKGK
jgi:hypothetical protein